MRGITEFISSNIISGLQTTFQVIYTGLLITVGLLLANVIAFPRQIVTQTVDDMTF